MNVKAMYKIQISVRMYILTIAVMASIARSLC